MRCDETGETQDGFRKSDQFHNVVDVLIYKLVVHCAPNHRLKCMNVSACNLVFMGSGHLTQGRLHPPFALWPV